MKVLPTLRSQVWVKRSYVYCKQPILSLTFRDNFAKVSSAVLFFCRIPLNKYSSKGSCMLRFIKEDDTCRQYFQRRPLKRKEEGKKSFHLCARNYAQQGNKEGLF